MQPVNNLFNSLYNSLPSAPRAAVIGGTLCALAAPVFAAVKDNSEVVPDPGYSVMHCVGDALLGLTCFFLLVVPLINKLQPNNDPQPQNNNALQPQNNNALQPQNNYDPNILSVNLPIVTTGMITSLRSFNTVPTRIYRDVGLENTGYEVMEAIVADSNLYPYFFVMNRDGKRTYLNLESALTIEEILQNGNVDVQKLMLGGCLFIGLANAADYQRILLWSIENKPQVVKSAASI